MPNTDPLDTLDTVSRDYFNRGQLAVEATRDPQITQITNAARMALGSADKLSRDALPRVKADMENIRLPFLDRQKLVAETLTGIDSEIDEHFSTAKTNIAAVKIILEESAMPDPAESHAASAEVREDLKIRTADLDTAKLITTLVDLAAGPDRALAGEIVRGRTATAMLSRLPEGERTQAANLIRSAAIRGSEKHGSPAKQQAAVASREAVQALTGALQARQTAVRFRVGEASEILDRARNAQNAAIDRAQGVR